MNYGTLSKVSYVTVTTCTKKGMSVDTGISIKDQHPQEGLEIFEKAHHIAKNST